MGDMDDSYLSDLLSYSRRCEPRIRAPGRGPGARGSQEAGGGAAGARAFVGAEQALRARRSGGGGHRARSRRPPTRGAFFRASRWIQAFAARARGDPRARALGALAHQAQRPGPSSAFLQDVRAPRQLRRGARPRIFRLPRMVAAHAHDAPRRPRRSAPTRVPRLVGRARRAAATAEGASSADAASASTAGYLRRMRAFDETGLDASRVPRAFRRRSRRGNRRRGPARSPAKTCRRTSACRHSTAPRYRSIFAANDPKPTPATIHADAVLIDPIPRSVAASADPGIEKAGARIAVPAYLSRSSTAPVGAAAADPRRGRAGTRQVLHGRESRARRTRFRRSSNPRSRTPRGTSSNARWTTPSSENLVVRTAPERRLRTAGMNSVERCGSGRRRRSSAHPRTIRRTIPRTRRRVLLEHVRPWRRL